MPLKVDKIKGSKNYYIRGTYRGVYVYKTTGTSNRKTADQDRKAAEDEIDAKGFISKSSSFADAVDKYIEAGGSEAYLLQVDKAGSWKKSSPMFHFANTPLDKIDQIALDAAAKLALPNVKPQTLNRQFYTPFIAVMNRAARLKMCDKHDWMRPRVKRSDTKRVKWFTYDDAKTFYKHAPDHLKAIFVFCIYTGSRMTEALELPISDVNMLEKWAVLNATKTDAYRGIPLHRFVLRELREYWEYRQWKHKFVEPAKMVFMTHKGNDYVSRREDDGTVGSSGYFMTTWKGTLLRAGLKGYTPYSMRHTFNNWLILAGVDETTREALMGHDSGSTNAIYSDVPQNHLIEVVERLKDFTEIPRQ